MDIRDPVTGKKLDIYGSASENTKSGDLNECWKCNEERVVAILQTEYNWTKEEAIKQLVHSDINHPVKMTDVIKMEVWAE